MPGPPPAVADLVADLVAADVSVVHVDGTPNPLPAAHAAPPSGGSPC
ncbi:hypothetical protein [Ornithinimicrobium sp. W1665]